MAIPKKHHSSTLPLVLTFLTFYSLNVVTSVTYSTTFTYDRFDSDTDLLMQGNAVFSPNFALELTKERNGIPQSGSVGRTFSTFPIVLHMSGKVATISTSFVLNISQPNSTATPADGITFFIAPISDLPPRSGGGFLGLFSNQTNASSTTSIVAVEFDTYPNLDIGDPNYRHIGINVNSIKSSATSRWNFQSGEPLNVTITYDPSLKRLRVYAGFSGSTGKYAEVNHVNSWSFNSTLVV
ncbi:hypothetical protein AAHE18_09G243100 [Arachis hypogaea]